MSAPRNAISSGAGLDRSALCNYSFVATSKSWFALDMGHREESYQPACSQGVVRDCRTDDPLALTLPDPYPDEERWRTIGSPSTQRDVVLFVVHTWPKEDEAGEEVGRIISARKATRYERRAYEEGTF